MSGLCTIETCPARLLLGLCPAQLLDEVTGATGAWFSSYKTYCERFEQFQECHRINVEFVTMIGDKIRKVDISCKLCQRVVKILIFSDVLAFQNYDFDSVEF